MTIGEILRKTDIDTYNKLMQVERKQQKKKEIKLGDRPENLMKHRSYSLRYVKYFY